MTSSESEHLAPPRKRLRTTNNGKEGVSGGGKKARGRPRVETKDVDAADRRRTQIRLAQRAYRQRKEKTIATLETQQNQLQSIIGQMSRAFDRVNDSTLRSGLLQLNPNLAQEFKVVSDTFAILVKTAYEKISDDDDDDNCETAASTCDRNAAIEPPPKSSKLPVADAQDVGWGYSVMNPTGKAESTKERIPTYSDPPFASLENAYAQAGTNTSLVRHQEFDVVDVYDQPGSSQKAPSQAPAIPPFGIVGLDVSQPFTPPGPHIYSMNISAAELTSPPTKLLTPPLQPPGLLSIKSVRPFTTYSFDESTFARRLTRAAIETGFQLLNDAEVRPEALKYIFKLSLPWFSLDQLIDRFKTMLSRGMNENLDFWETPFIHLGGAGTHYPRRDPEGNVIPIRNGWTVRQVGPVEKKMARLQNEQDGLFQDIDGVDLSGFEGEWYDAHDVEGYFEDKYLCKIDPRRSFAECWIDEDDDLTGSIFSSAGQYDMSTRRSSDEDLTTPSLTHSSSSGSSSSSVLYTPPTNTSKPPDTLFSTTVPLAHSQPPRYSNDLPRFGSGEISFDQTLGLDLAPGFDYGFLGSGGCGGSTTLGLDLVSDNGNNLPLIRQKRKKSAWVDVNRLVDEIVKYAVCLGRAPGFRRGDIDIAFHKSLLPPY